LPGVGTTAIWWLALQVDASAKVFGDDYV